MKHGKAKGRLFTKEEVIALLDNRCPDCDTKLVDGPKSKSVTTDVLDCRWCSTRFSRLNKEAREHFGITSVDDLIGTVWAERVGPILEPVK